MKIQHFGASTISKDTHIYLVGGFSPPLWKMMEWKSVGMMKFPTEWKNHPAMFQTTNQLYISHLTNSWTHSSLPPRLLHGCLQYLWTPKRKRKQLQHQAILEPCSPGWPPILENQSNGGDSRNVFTENYDSYMFISFCHDPFNKPPAFFCKPPWRPLGHDVPLPSRSVESLYEVHLFRPHFCLLVCTPVQP